MGPGLRSMPPNHRALGHGATLPYVPSWQEKAPKGSQSQRDKILCPPLRRQMHGLGRSCPPNMIPPLDSKGTGLPAACPSHSLTMTSGVSSLLPCALSSPRQSTQSTFSTSPGVISSFPRQPFQTCLDGFLIQTRFPRLGCVFQTMLFLFLQAAGGDVSLGQVGSSTRASHRTRRTSVRPADGWGWAGEEKGV